MIHRLLAVLIVALAPAWMSIPVAHAAGGICSELARVSWQVDRTSILVRGVTVEVVGCEDGEFVGIELITDDGVVPEDGALSGSVEGEVARFDVSAFELRVEPVIGIRVYLEVDGIPTPVVTITVEQRFFTPDGQEQVQLRLTTELVVRLGGAYVVPGPWRGYEHVECRDLGVEVDQPTVAEGLGTFTATASGLHLVCYLRIEAAPEEPEVIDDIEEAQPVDEIQEPVVVDDLEETTEADEDDDPTTVLDQVLARTGASTAHLMLIGGLSLAIGVALRRRASKEDNSVSSH